MMPSSRCNNPYSTSAADDFEHFFSNIWKISMSVGIITEQKFENIVVKGEIARFVLFFLFVTMFSKSRLLPRRLYKDCLRTVRTRMSRCAL